MMSEKAYPHSKELNDLGVQTDVALNQFRETAEKVSSGFDNYDQSMETFQKACLKHLGYNSKQMDVFKQMQTFFSNKTK